MQGDTLPAPPFPAAQFAEPPLGAGRNTLVRSGIVTVAGQLSMVAVAIASTMILARLLGPRDFGLVAMTTSLTAFISSFRDFGFPMATLQSKSIDELGASCLFWINLKLNVGVAAFMIAMAPVLVWFYGDSRLLALTAVMSVGTFAAGIVNQHEALLTRQLRFTAIVTADLSSFIAASALAAYLAWKGAGYWTLAVQYILWQSARSVILIRLSRWTPYSPKRSAAASPRMRELLAFSRDLTLSRVVAHVGRNVDRVVVGYTSGAYALGLYSAANRWSLFPIQQIYTPLMAPAIAALSRSRYDPQTYIRACKSCLLPVFGFSIPCLAFLITDAGRVVSVLLGTKWMAAVPLFQWLAFGAIAAAATMVTKWIYISLKQADRQLRWVAFSTCIMIAAIIAGARFGARGVAISFALGNWLLLIPGIAFCLQDSPFRMGQFFAVLRNPAVASAAAAALLFVIQQKLVLASDLVTLLLHGLVFLGIYILVWMLLPGGRKSLLELFHLLYGALPRRIRSERFLPRSKK